MHLPYDGRFLGLRDPWMPPWTEALPTPAAPGQALRSTGLGAESRAADSEPIRPQNVDKMMMFRASKGSFTGSWMALNLRFHMIPQHCTTYT